MDSNVQHELVNGKPQVAMSNSKDVTRLGKYALTGTERQIFIEHNLAIQRVQAAMQGAVQVIAVQQGFKNARLSEDFSELEEQAEQKAS
jgi:hypothetical protein